MFFAGIDVGSRYLKVVLINEAKNIFGKKSAVSGFDNNSIAKSLLSDVCDSLKVSIKDIERIGVTGSGKNTIDFGSKEYSEVLSAVKAVYFLNQEVRTIIEVGAEESRAIKINKEGKVIDIAVNEKCAAGTGTFVELMARTLEIGLKDFGELSLESEKRIPMNAQCIVFAESEVVSLIHSGTDRKDIARAIHDAIANRIASMARRVKIEPEVALVGGLGKNPGFVFSLKNTLELDNLFIPENPEFIGAFGSALLVIDEKN